MNNRDLIPFDVREKPKPVQRAWLREFERVLDQTGSSRRAVNAADKLLDVHNERQKKINIRENLTVRPVTLDASISEFARANAEQYVPASILADIRKTDSHPYFAVWEVATEGISKGEGIKKVWSFGAIKELAKRAADRLARVFHQHGDKDNSHEDRKSLGEVVHGFTKKVGNALKAYAVSYVADKATREKIEKGELDICSIEANVGFTQKQRGGDWFIEGVEKLTGLALSSSKIDKPGFAGASVTAVIRELAERDRVMADEGNVRKTYTKAEVKLAIEDLNLSPSDLFHIEDLKKVDAIVKHIDETVKTATDKVEKAKKKLEDELTPLKQAEAKNTVADLIKKSALLTEAPQQQIDYIIGQLQSNGDILDAKGDELTVKIDAGVKAQIEQITNLGIKFEPKKDDDGDKNADGKGKGGGENKSNNENQSESDPNDYFTQFEKDNPMLASSDK